MRKECFHFLRLRYMQMRRVHFIAINRISKIFFSIIFVIRILGLVGLRSMMYVGSKQFSSFTRKKKLRFFLYRFCSICTRSTTSFVLISRQKRPNIIRRYSSLIIYIYVLEKGRMRDFYLFFLLPSIDRCPHKKLLSIRYHIS